MGITPPPARIVPEGANFLPDQSGRVKPGSGNRHQDSPDLVQGSVVTGNVFHQVQFPELVHHRGGYALVGLYDRTGRWRGERVKGGPAGKEKARWHHIHRADL